MASPLRPGEGRAFAEAMRAAVEHASAELREAFDADSYIRQRSAVLQEQEQRRAAMLEELQQQAGQLGFALQLTPGGVVSAPIIDGQPASDEVMAALPAEQREQIQERSREQLEPLVQDSLLAMRGVQRGTQERLEEVDEQVARFAIEHLFEPLRERWRNAPGPLGFIEAVCADMQRGARPLPRAAGRGAAGRPAAAGPRRGGAAARGADAALRGKRLHRQRPGRRRPRDQRAQPQLREPAGPHRVRRPVRHGGHGSHDDPPRLARPSRAAAT